MRWSARLPHHPEFRRSVSCAIARLPARSYVRYRQFLHTLLRPRAPIRLAKMNIHEYQAKALFRSHGVPVPDGGAATNEREARTLLQEHGPDVVIKAQVHAGGRGKGRVVKRDRASRTYNDLKRDPERHEGQIAGRRRGGVRLASGVEEGLKEFRPLMDSDSRLVSVQTGPEGVPISAALIEKQSAIAKEFYFSIQVDGANGQPLVVASAEGGQSIEEVNRTNPRAVLRIPVDPTEGFPAFRGRTLASELGLPSSAIRPAGEMFANLYNVFTDMDASLVEVNPFVLTTDGAVVAIDGKVGLDDNASFRHGGYEEWRDRSQENPTEIEAEEANIGSYIKLDGNIGCVVNGAGLAMATMDTLKLHGGEPANFLDIGTVNRKDRVVEALRIIVNDSDVKAIFINIFGGLARVDIVAEGVVDAVNELKIQQPLVVRLNGSNVEEGRRVLHDSGIDVQTADELGDAAELAVTAAATAKRRSRPKS